MKLSKSIHKCFFSISTALLVLPASFCLSLKIESIASAQIVPDATLPTNSIVSPSCTTCTITGGTQVGTNLFHSFTQFSIPALGAAIFDNSLNIQNIITRVTGNNISNIDGLIKANGTANLFLINPNGIIFGSNAALNIGGSFIGSTATSIKFADGSEFSSTNPQAPSLLTINTPVGLQYGSNPGKIEVQGAGNNLVPNPQDFSIISDFRPVGLQVQPGKTLALVGGNVELQGGNLTAAGGQIELGSVGKGSTVALSQTSLGWSLDYQGVANFQDIQLSGAASVDASGNSGGNIHIQGRNVRLTGGSAILTDTIGSGTGGNLTVRADTLEVTGIASDNAPFLEPGIPFFSGLFTDVAPGATGNGGTLSIETRRLLVADGGQISSGTFSSGNAGALKVMAQDIELTGTSILGPSGLFAPVAVGATGNGGNLTLETGGLLVTDGAQVSTITLGEGKAGNVILKAQDVRLLGTSSDGSSRSGLYANTFETATGNGGNLTIFTENLQLSGEALISTTTFGIGNAGALNINTTSLQVSNGSQIQAGTISAGNGGDIFITANKSVELVGASAGGRSGILASAIFGTGNGGNINLTTNQLTVKDGATLSVSNFSSRNPSIPPGSGAAGNLNIDARSIFIDNGGILTAEAAVGDRGNINLKSGNIFLRQGSAITTNAQGTATGGNINISTNNLVAIGNSDITANSVANFGGRVVVSAKAIYGTQFRQQLTPESDITASSDLGAQFSGTVEIKRPEVDPDSGLIQLPSDVVDAANQISSSCRATAANSFVVTGRGGLPENPRQALRGKVIWQDIRTVQANTGANINLSREQSQTPNPESPLVEAQGWIVDSQGKLSLVAQSPQVNPQDAWYKQVACKD